MPSRVSAGVGDCSSTAAEPMTEIWCGVAGKLMSSYVGSSEAAADAASRNDVAWKGSFWMTMFRPHIPQSRFAFLGPSLTRICSKLYFDHLTIH
jgi:hypothetical protein